MIRLLLADDERIIREGIERMIPCRELGIEITASCANALSALDSMTDALPDILLTDIKMPGMDGLALIERALTLKPDLQCVILSGYEEFDFARKAMGLGVKEYLLKPCDPQELREVLARLCQAVRERRARAENAFGTRQRRVREMAARMEEMLEGEELSLCVVEAALNAAEDASIIREALIYVVSHRVEAPGEWGLQQISGIYDQGPEALAEKVVECLRRLQTLARGGGNLRGKNEGLHARPLQRAWPLPAISCGSGSAYERGLHRQGIRPGGGAEGERVSDTGAYGAGEKAAAGPKGALDL